MQVRNMIMTLLFAAILVLLCIKCGLAAPNCSCEPPTEQENIEDYISVSKHLVKGTDVAEVAELIVTCAEEGKLDPWVLVFIAEREAGFDIWNVSGAGERGLLQVHPIHVYRFNDYGLDWSDYADCFRFGVCMLREGATKGKTLYSSMRPWSVRDKAGVYNRYVKHNGGTEDGWFYD